MAGAADSPGGDLSDLDTGVAHPARVYDYWLGGTDNFPADREAAERVLAATPGLRWRVRANRAFLGRATRFLAADAGIRQFLDIGTGIPAAGNTHEVAQRAAPQARVATPQTLRTREQVARFFTGLDLVEPGLVQVHQWRPDPDDAAPADAVSAHGGVGRKLCDPAPGTAESGGYYLRRQLRPSRVRTAIGIRWSWSHIRLPVDELCINSG